MTVTYTGDVANGSSFGCFWKILGRWKGSVYKLVWRELIVYLTVYFIINLLYRYTLDFHQRSIFEKLKVYCSKQIDSIPMSFVLGFYVMLIVKRWWDQYWVLPLPDSLALYISASIQGQDERGRILRRTIMRYAMLSFIIMMQRISVRVKKRFPTLQHLVDTGLMMESEMKIFDGLEAKTSVSKFWLPCVWASNLVNRARLEGRIQSDHMVQTILTELSEFRRRLGLVGIYDNISVPLVYTQVVTLAVYTYFTAALMGRQWVNPDDPVSRTKIYPGYELDLYFPIFLSLQFIFYIGWLKVAETLINPFGEDDDDYEINWLIDRHIQVCYMVVDEIHEDHPELLKDQYWEQVVPAKLPYNQASNNYRRREPKGSTASMKIKENEAIYDTLTTKRRQSLISNSDVYGHYESVIDSPMGDNRKNWLQRQISRMESFRSTSSSPRQSNRIRSQLHPSDNGLSLSPDNTLPNSTGPRVSLYDKLMNRRSSKERLRFLTRGPPINGGPKINGGPQTINSHIPYPNLRPRVPTPEVTKDSQGNFVTTTVPIQKLSRSQINNHNNSSGITNNNIYGLSTNSLNVGITPTQFPPDSQDQQRPRNLSLMSPPPSYDSTNPPNIMLSPIEENDSSPYSTSSTNRSNKSSSHYPTTTLIFGRKPSPPPPREELPPIPTETDLLRNELVQNSKFLQHNNIDTIVDIDEGENFEESYMTIDEVGETKTGLELLSSQENLFQPTSFDKRVKVIRIPNIQHEIINNNSDKEKLIRKYPNKTRSNPFIKTKNMEVVNSPNHISSSSDISINNLPNNNLKNNKEIGHVNITFNEEESEPSAVSTNIITKNDEVFV